MDELTELALDAGRGDRRALEQFVRRSQPDVYRFCVHLAGGHLAEDLTQDTYLRAIPALAGFRGESSVRTWILAIARRALADSIRVQARQRRLIEKIAARATDEPLVDNRSNAVVADLLARLDLDRREAFVVTQLLGFRYAEAAEILGCPVGTIRSRVARAREDLVAMVRDDSSASDSIWVDAPWADPVGFAPGSRRTSADLSVGNQSSGPEDY